MALGMRTVRELPIFQDLVEGRLTDLSWIALVDFVAEHPDAGDLIPGAGGARKLRWAASSRGKRGGARIIIYWHCDGCPVYLLGIYLKSEREDLTRAEINDYKTLCKELADEHHVKNTS